MLFWTGLEVDWNWIIYQRFVALSARSHRYPRMHLKNSDIMHLMPTVLVLWSILQASWIRVWAQQNPASESASASTTQSSGEVRTGAGNKLDILYAINCGGEEHVDHFGVPYQGDPSKDGQSSDYGLHWQTIASSHPDDFILYQTERYSESTFGYDIPLPKPAKATSYVLVLKFAEVYFNQAQMKVFDVLLNGDHLIVDGLDIFERAGGRAAAYDVHIPFRITGNKLLLTNTGEESDYSGTLRLDFVKTSQDNPKCNAFYVARGTVEDIPKLEVKRSGSVPDEDDEDDVSSKRASRGQSLDEQEDEWPSVSLDFPTPAPEPAEDIQTGFDRYYPVIAVFLFIALITAFLFKI